MATARTLIYIPIIHSAADMGALRESVQRVTLQKLGEKGWENRISLIDSLWDKIETVIGDLSLSYEKVRLYQDGLPVCGLEVKIVTEIAKAGSRNHLLLINLMEKGATIMGTESPELLIEEYNLVKRILSAENSVEAAKIEVCQKPLSDVLLKKRDQYIADRVNRTLGMDETGIIFLGMLHSLDSLLEKDIQVIYPIFRHSDLGG
jgi:hypothetical protein